MYCTNCGNKTKEGEIYCSNCGTIIHKETVESFNENQPSNSSVPSKNNSSLIVGIFACVSFWFPIIAIPLAIISIVLGKKQKETSADKSIGVTLGTISLILSIITMVLIIIFFIFIIKWAEDLPDEEYNTNEIIDGFYDYNNEKSFDIKGYSWLGDDNSVLYLNKDKTYSWYRDDKVHTDNFYSGKYDFYTGDDAINYIANNLKEYGITKEEQQQLFRNGSYQLKDYYLIILECDTSMIGGKNETPENSLIYYYGFYNEIKNRFDLINMNTGNPAGFTKMEKLSSIDL